MGNNYTESIQASSRIPWLDAIRGVAFLMVIYSHLDYCDAHIMRYFSPIFLTTFFFVSGYLFKKNKSFGVVLEQRIRTLLIPLLIFGTVMILMTLVFSLHEHVPVSLQFKGLLLQFGENQILWFIAALFIYSLVFYWIVALIPDINKMLLACFALFVLNYIYKYSLHLPSLPWHFDSCGFGCFYMGLGLWYRKYEELVKKTFRYRYIILGLAIYVAVITYLGYSCNFQGDATLAYSLLLTILGLYVMVGVFNRINLSSALILFIGANTLFYFAFHGKGYSILQSVSEKIFDKCAIAHSGMTNAFVALLIVLLDALLLILPCILVNKFFPFATGKGYKLWYSK